LKKIIHHIILFFNLAAILLLLLAYISAYISPERYWILAFFGLAYPFFLLANVLFIVYWTLMRKKELFLSLIAILLGLNYLTSLYQPEFLKESKKNQPIDPSIRQFKVLSYNVRLFDLYNWITPGSHHQIVDFIVKERPDIICLQEFYNNDKGKFSLKELFNELNFTPYHHVYYTNNDKNSHLYGIATFTKYPVIHRGTIKFNNTKNICIFTDIVIGKDTIRIYNNHLQSIYLTSKHYELLDSLKFSNDKKQKQEILDITYRLKSAYIKRAKQVDVIAAHIKQSPYPVIVCGDFNDTPVSYTYHTMRGKLHDSFYDSGDGFGNTYVGKFPSFRIDFIFHSANLISYDFRRIKVKLSDHYPISCNFQISSFRK
jgi:endonuclease/exonuclease/phosphatase family metal-dependent hydrolase